MKDVHSKNSAMMRKMLVATTALRALFNTDQFLDCLV